MGDDPSTPSKSIPGAAANQKDDSCSAPQDHAVQDQQMPPLIKPYSKKLQALREAQFQKMQRSLLMQELLRNDQPGDAVRPPSNVDDMIMGYVDGTEGTQEEKQKASEKQKRESVMEAKRKRFFDKLRENERKNKPDPNDKLIKNANEFQCQQITVKSPLWGDIFITKEFFMFVSFGLDTPSNYIYVKQQTILGKKKKLILRWRDIEEIACRKLLNLDIGLEIQTMDKKIKSFNLLTIPNKARFFNRFASNAMPV